MLDFSTCFISDSLDLPADQPADLYHGRWPIVGRWGSRMSAETVTELILSAETETDKICHSVPQGCGIQATFIVDTNSLALKEDLSYDGNGKFNRPSTTKTDVKVSCKVYTVQRNRSSHAGTDSFRRIISKIACDGQHNPLVMIQYFFTDGEVKPLVYLPHKNKRNQSEVFVARKPSTRMKIKEAAASMPPAKVMSTLTKEAGGVGRIENLSDVPRDSTQIYNLKRSSEKQGGISNFTALTKLTIEGEYVKAFEVNKGGHPRLFCATQQQIMDIQTFCTGKDGNLFVIDPTFELGDYYLTTSWYRYPNILNKNTMQSVLMPGPFMVHARREAGDYEFFGRHITECLGGKKIHAWGTDGEQALIKGLSSTDAFRDSIHLICMLHARKKVRSELAKLKYSETEIEEVLTDIYGSETQGCHRTRIRGLVDSQTAYEFELCLDQLIEKWGDMESERGQEPTFPGWFRKYKASECKNHMMAPLREEAKLGDPPKQFTSNDAEVQNLAIKRCTEWKKTTWDGAVHVLHGYILGRCAHSISAFSLAILKFRHSLLRSH